MRNQRLPGLLEFISVYLPLDDFPLPRMCSHSPYRLCHVVLLQGMFSQCTGHAYIPQALRLAGIGGQRVLHVPMDDGMAMGVFDLEHTSEYSALAYQREALGTWLSGCLYGCRLENEAVYSNPPVFP